MASRAFMILCALPNVAFSDVYLAFYHWVTEFKVASGTTISKRFYGSVTMRLS